MNCDQSEICQMNRDICEENCDLKRNEPTKENLQSTENSEVNLTVGEDEPDVNNNHKANIHTDDVVKCDKHEQQRNDDIIMTIEYTTTQDEASEPDIDFEIVSDHDETYFTEVLNIDSLIALIDTVNLTDRDEFSDQPESLHAACIDISTTEDPTETLHATESVARAMQKTQDASLDASSCEENFSEYDDQSKDLDWTPGTETENEASEMIVEHEEIVNTSNQKRETGFDENRRFKNARQELPWLWKGA